jgi:hypothetical protein
MRSVCRAPLKMGMSENIADLTLEISATAALSQTSATDALFRLSRIVRASGGKCNIRVASYSIAEERYVFIVDFCELLKLHEIHTPLAEFAF